jgi:hypothetical protein
MGKRCNPKNTVGTIRAENQLSGDIFSEAKRVKDFDAGQLSAYEMQMAKRLGMIDDGPSALDVIKAKSPKSVIKAHSKHTLKPSLYAPPSESLKGRFWNDIDGKFSDFYRKPEAERNYNEDIAKPARTVKTAIETILKSGSNKKELDARLKRFGIKTDQSYEALEYLDWVVKGGPETPIENSWLRAANAAASSVSKAQANYNLLWTAGNGADMIRVYSHFATKKGGGINAVIQGTYDAWKASGGNIFRQIPALKKKGFYHSGSIDVGSNNRDPFSWTATAQKNLAYYMDRASGGDGHSGVSEIVFDRKSWDAPSYERFAGKNLIVGLARYPINETRWYFGTIKKAFKGDSNAQANLLLYSLARAATTGTKSLVPALLWNKLSEEDKENLEKLDELSPLNIKANSRMMLKSIGVDAEIDLSSYLQPLGGNLGARADSIGKTVTKSLGAATGTLVYAAKGKLSASAVSALATVSALANFGLFKGNANKILNNLDQNFNAALLTKTLETTAEFLADEMELDKYEQELLKDAFGMTLKKAD